MLLTMLDGEFCATKPATEIRACAEAVLDGSATRESALTSSLWPTTKPASLYERLAATESDPVLVFGYTSWVQEYSGALFVNCGSVGKPKDGDPRGAFAILTPNGQSVGVSIERIACDADAVAAEIREAYLPGESADKLPVAV